MSKPSTKAGMRIRRPGKRTPTDDEIAALETQAEQIASKVPGDSVADAPEASEAPEEPRHQTKESPSKPSAQRRRDTDRKSAPRKKKKQLTVYVSATVKEELRRAAVALSGPPSHESITSIVERAIVKELKALRKEHGTFPDTAANPRPGRRAI